MTATDQQRADHQAARPLAMFLHIVLGIDLAQAATEAAQWLADSRCGEHDHELSHALQVDLRRTAGRFEAMLGALRQRWAPFRIELANMLRHPPNEPTDAPEADCRPISADELGKHPHEAERQAGWDAWAGVEPPNRDHVITELREQAAHYGRTRVPDHPLGGGCQVCTNKLKADQALAVAYGAAAACLEACEPPTGDDHE